MPQRLSDSVLEQVHVRGDMAKMEIEDDKSRGKVELPAAAVWFEPHSQRVGRCRGR